MKLSALFSASLLLGLMRSGAAAQDLPEGALQAGSLANQQLIQDAMMGAAAKVAMLGCDTPETPTPLRNGHA